MYGNGFIPAERVDLFVGLAFDADRGQVDSHRQRQLRPHRGNMRRQPRAFGNDDGVDVRHRVAEREDDRDRAFQKIA